MYVSHFKLIQYYTPTIFKFKNKNKQEGLSFSSLPSGIYSFSHGPQIIFYTQITFKVHTHTHTHTHTQWYHTAPVGIYLLFSLSISWISFYASTYGANKVFCSKTIPCCAVLSHLSHVQLFATPGSSVHGILQARNTGVWPCPPPEEVPQFIAKLSVTFSISLSKMISQMDWFFPWPSLNIIQTTVDLSPEMSQALH